MSSGDQRRRRVIFLKFKPDTPQPEIEKVLDKIHENFTGMPGLRDLEMGPQTSESSDFTHGITFVLDDDAALEYYRENAEHKELRKLYFDLLEKAQTSEIRAR